MGLKSSWAFKNGKRELDKINESLKPNLNGWVKTKIGFAYAELHKPSGSLFAKTYSNKKQADDVVKKLINEGHDVYRSDKWPYVIIQTKPTV